MLPNMFNIFESYRSPMYTPYGIGIKKEHLHRLGAIHVFYGTNEDLSLLPNTLKWRFGEYMPNKKDYTWLREWRINTSSVKLSDTLHIIVYKTDEE